MGDYIGDILIYWDNGKENGNYYLGFLFCHTFFHYLGFRV